MNLPGDGRRGRWRIAVRRPRGPDAAVCVDEHRYELGIGLTAVLAHLDRETDRGLDVTSLREGLEATGVAPTHHPPPTLAVVGSFCAVG
jgi:hypothetical protein